MNILILGKNSKLGIEFQKMLKKNDISFLATTKFDLDLSKKNSIENFFDKFNDFTHIINCAAYNNVDNAEIDVINMRKVNTEAAIELSKYAKKINAIYVSYSTDFVFDGEKKTPYIETDIVNPLSEYGKSKYDAEIGIRQEYNKIFLIRTSWLFGIGGSNFITQIIDLANSNNKINVVDDQVSSPTYTKDLVYFSWELIKTNKFGLYHITNSGEASKHDQAKYVLKKIKWNGNLVKAKTSDFNLMAKRASYSKLSNDKIERLLNKKMTNWKEAIDRYLEELFLL